MLILFPIAHLCFSDAHSYSVKAFDNEENAVHGKRGT